MHVHLYILLLNYLFKKFKNNLRAKKKCISLNIKNERSKMIPAPLNTEQKKKKSKVVCSCCFCCLLKKDV